MGIASTKRCYKNIIYGGWGTLFAFLLGAGIVGGAHAASPALLIPDPISLGLKPGEAGQVAMRVQGVENLYGVELHLSFDPVLVAVVDANPAEAVSGEGVLAAIIFEGEARGSSPLKIDQAILDSRVASQISSETQDCILGVSAGGRASAVSGTQNQTSTAAALSPRLIAIAGLAMLVFLDAMVILVTVLRRRRN